jgi:HEAT repeat protein
MGRLGMAFLALAGSSLAALVAHGAPVRLQADARAQRLAEVAAWPSREGDRFVERSRRELEATPWLIGVLSADELQGSELTEPMRQALLEALRRTPWEHVRDALHASAAPGDASEAIATSVFLLGELGDAAELEHVVRLVSPGMERERADIDPLLLPPFREAVTSLLRRDPRTVLELAQYFGREHRALWAPLSQAVGLSGNVRVLDPLARLLNQDPELDALLLAQIGRLAEKAAPGTEWHVGLAVRAFLLDSQPGMRREAALTLGKLEDAESAGELIGLLEDESDGVRKSALWALRAIAGQDLGEDPRRWLAWYLQEVDWWRADYRRIADTLRDGAPEEIGPAISELSLRRLFRHPMAADLASLLKHERPEIRARACVALRELEALAGARELVGALEDDHPEVRQAAAEALAASSGLHLPPEPEPWIEALALDP